MIARRAIFGFFIIIVIITVVVLWHKKNKPDERPANTAPQATTTAPAMSSESSFQTNVEPTQVARNTGTAEHSSYGEQMKEGLAMLNDVPIAFYGRLEDQFGNAVFGAQIDANVRVYNGVESTMERLTTVSDGNGMFHIQGDKGESLGLMPKKAGYVLATTNTYFKFSYLYSDHFSSDPNRPTVIKMWRLKGAEPLVKINQKYKLNYTATPINFDLLTGQIIPTGGDLRITVSRPEGIISQQNPQNWSIAIEVVNGGFIETSSTESANTYAAPQDGYQTAGVFGNNNGPDLVDEDFFIQSRNGQVFSKIHLLFGINSAPDGLMSIKFTGAANANGSRNWEETAQQ